VLPQQIAILNYIYLLWHRVASSPLWVDTVAKVEHRRPAEFPTISAKRLLQQ